MAQNSNKARYFAYINIEMLIFVDDDLKAGSSLEPISPNLAIRKFTNFNNFRTIKKQLGQDQVTSSSLGEQRSTCLQR